MTPPRMKIAGLEPARLAKVRGLEEELGTYVVALEPEFRLAALTATQLERLEAVKKELGGVLLAMREGRRPIRFCGAQTG